MARFPLSLPTPTTTAGTREGRARLGHPAAPPRPAPSPWGQEARKETAWAMDGAVMEGPLFLQSQRFGTKVVCLWRWGWWGDGETLLD